MTTCKQPQLEGNLTPQPPSLLGKGEQDWNINQAVIPVHSPGRGGLGRGSLIPVHSPGRGGLGRGSLYLLQKSIKANSSGFTIIECLLAIIIVSILMTAIAPVIVLSVATRVQARRVEQATQAARSYIDSVQSGTILKPEATVLLEENQNGAYTSQRDIFAIAPAPPQRIINNCSDDRSTNPGSIYPYCDNGTTGPFSLYCVDNDGNGCTSNSSRDYIVQAFRSVKTTSSGVTDTGAEGYVLGVRVYRADAFDGTSVLTTTKATSDAGRNKVATHTGGRGNKLAPLVEMTTEVRPKQDDTNPGSALKNLKERLGSAPTPSP